MASMCEDESCAPKSLHEWLWPCLCACVPVWVWLSQSSSASLQSAKVGQPNLSQGGAEELLLCFLLTVEVITSLVMQMSIPLFKLSAMQGSCQRRHIKKILHLLCLFSSTFPFFSPLSFLNQISGTWQHKHQTLMWKTTPLYQKTRQSQSLYHSPFLFSYIPLLSCSFAHIPHSHTHVQVVMYFLHPYFIFFFFPLP